GRVTALGLLHLIDPKYATGDFHTFIGLLMLIPAAGAFLLLGWILDRIIIREEGAEEEEEAAPRPPSAAPAPVAEPMTGREVAGLAGGAIAGAVIALLAAAVYNGMLGTRSPGESLIDASSSGGMGLLL